MKKIVIVYEEEIDGKLIQVTMQNGRATATYRINTPEETTIVSATMTRFKYLDESKKEMVKDVINKRVETTGDENQFQGLVSNLKTHVKTKGEKYFKLIEDLIAEDDLEKEGK